MTIRDMMLANYERSERTRRIRTCVSTEPAEPTKSMRNKKYIVFGIVAGGLILGGLIASAVVCFKLFAHAVEPPMTALNIYTDTLIQKDYESSYAITSPALRAAISYPDFLKYQDLLTAKHGALKSAKQIYWDIETSNGTSTCTIQADLQFESSKLKFEFVLRKEDGIWRVFSYRDLDTDDVGNS